MTPGPALTILSSLMMALALNGCDAGKAGDANDRANADANKPILVTVNFVAPANCGVEMNNVYYGLPEAQDALDEALKSMSKSRTVAINAPTKIPYRCMGPVIYYFQRAGFDHIEGGGKDDAQT